MQAYILMRLGTGECLKYFQSYRYCLCIYLFIDCDWTKNAESNTVGTSHTVSLRIYLLTVTEQKTLDRVQSVPVMQLLPVYLPVCFLFIIVYIL